MTEVVIRESLFSRKMAEEVIRESLFQKFRDDSSVKPILKLLYANAVNN